METLILNLIQSGLWAAIPAIGFAMIFNVPSSTLIFCGMGGGVTYILREVLLQYWTIELSTFVASLAIGIVGVYWSKKYIMPRPVYTVASIIPMIPGTYAYNMMISLMLMNSQGVTQELLFKFIENGLHAIAILGAIAFGLALPSLYYTKLKRPVV